MTEEDRRNERLKLFATWTNTISTGVLTVGCFIPVAQFLFQILPRDVDQSLVYGTGAACLGMAVLIHLAGQWTLGNLE
jgi:hypothetical protein